MATAMATVTEPVETVDRFLRETGEKNLPGQRFARESARMLRIDVDGGVWLKPGAAIAYRGDVAFERLPTLDATSVTDAVVREMNPLVRATGRGRLYCARHGMHVRLLRLAGDSVMVAWPDLLAFEDSLSFESGLVAHGIGVAAGGLVAVKLWGHGAVGISTHGDPLSLRVTPDAPVSTDPHATLAWSSTLTPTLKTDLSWRSVFRHGGHEPVQMHFAGDGFVAVQPFEDPGRIAVSFNPWKRIKALVTGV